MILRNYIYLDENAINGLYNQIYDNILEETISVHRSNENEIKSSISASGILKSFVNAEGSYDLSLSSQKMNEKKITLTLEKKANLLITKVSEDKYEYIKDILDRYHPLKESRIFVGNALFTLTALYDKQGFKTNLDDYLRTYYSENPSLVL